MSRLGSDSLLDRRQCLPPGQRVREVGGLDPQLLGLLAGEVGRRPARGRRRRRGVRPRRRSNRALPRRSSARAGRRCPRLQAASSSDAAMSTGVKRRAFHADRPFHAADRSKPDEAKLGSGSLPSPRTRDRSSRRSRRRARSTPRAPSSRRRRGMIGGRSSSLPEVCVRMLRRWQTRAGFVVNARDASWRSAEVPGSVCVFGDDDELRTARRQRVRPRAWRNDGDVSLGGGPGGLHRRLWRRAADRRGRGNARCAHGISCTARRDAARDRRRRSWVLRRRRGWARASITSSPCWGGLHGGRGRAPARRRRRA